LQEILFGRKIGVSKKSKREVRHTKQGSDPGLPQRRWPHLSQLGKNNLNRSFAQNLKISGVNADAAVRGQ